MRELRALLSLAFNAGMLRPYEDRRGRMTDVIRPETKAIGDIKFHEHDDIDPAAVDRWITTTQVGSSKPLSASRLRPLLKLDDKRFP